MVLWCILEHHNGAKINDTNTDPSNQITTWVPVHMVANVQGQSPPIGIICLIIKTTFSIG